MTVEDRTIQTGMITIAVSFGFWGCVDTGTGNGEDMSFSEVKGTITSSSLSFCIVSGSPVMTSDTLDARERDEAEGTDTKEQLSKAKLDWFPCLHTRVSTWT